MADIESIRVITQLIANYSTMIIAPIMTAIIARKVWQEYKETRQINYIRFLILLIFITFTWAIIPTNLYESTALKEMVDEETIGTNIYTINPYSIAIGFMVTFSLCMIAYANRWEPLYYAPLFNFGGLLVLYYLTGYDGLYPSYILLGGVVGLVFFYITGLRLRDNGSLGLGVFFTFAYVSVLFGETIPGDIFTTLIAVFGLLFALGYFSPFNEEEVVNNE